MNEIRTFETDPPKLPPNRHERRAAASRFRKALKARANELIRAARRAAEKGPP